MCLYHCWSIYRELHCIYFVTLEHNLHIQRGLRTFLYLRVHFVPCCRATARVHMYTLHLPVACVRISSRICCTYCWWLWSLPTATRAGVATVRGAGNLPDVLGCGSASVWYTTAGFTIVMLIVSKYKVWKGRRTANWVVLHWRPQTCVVNEIK